MVICQAWIDGVSTRKVDQLLKALGNTAGISRSQVSRVCTQIDQAVGEFSGRVLDHTWFPYLDATYLHVRLGGRVVSQALVIATGIAATGRREILGLAFGDAEITDLWTEFFRGLRARGLKVSSPTDPLGRRPGHLRCVALPGRPTPAGSGQAGAGSGLSHRRPDRAGLTRQDWDAGGAVGSSGPCGVCAVRGGWGAWPNGDCWPNGCSGDGAGGCWGGYGCCGACPEGCCP